MLMREKALDVRRPWHGGDSQGGRRTMFVVDKGASIESTHAISLSTVATNRNAVVENIVPLRTFAVALVEQQARQIRAHTDLRVGEYHGRRNVDSWTAENWSNELRDNEVRDTRWSRMPTLAN